MSDDSGMLLVGGSGFFGSALAKALVNGGHKVHVLSRECEEDESDGIEWHAGDQEDPDAVLPLLDQCDSIAHLESTSTPGHRQEHPCSKPKATCWPSRSSSRPRPAVHRKDWSRCPVAAPYTATYPRSRSMRTIGLNRVPTTLPAR